MEQHKIRSTGKNCSHYSLLVSPETSDMAACFGEQVSSKYGTWYSERVTVQFGYWAGVIILYLRLTVLTSPNMQVGVSKRSSCSISLVVYCLQMTALQKLQKSIQTLKILAWPACMSTQSIQAPYFGWYFEELLFCHFSSKYFFSCFRLLN